MVLRLLFIAFIICLFSACRQGITDNKKSLGNQKQGVFAMNVAFTDAEKFVSFPIWFTDSVISNQGIKKITRKFFYITTLDVDNEVNEKELREMKEYWFDSKGSLIKMKFSYYYDGEKIGSSSFSYSGPKNENGYSPVKVLEDNDITMQIDEDKSSNYFVHSFSRSTKKYQSYREMESGDYLFMIKNKNYWGPLTVDSVLNPTPYDIVFLGNSFKPEKRYSVNNKVNEKDVVEWKYINSTNDINSIKRDDYPFEHKRTFSWNKVGNCTGFIDSTFSSGSYVTRDRADIVLNKKKRPTHIVHRKENQDKKLVEFAIEIISYEH